MVENLTIEQWIEKSPYLKKLSEYTIFTSKEDLDKIKTEGKIEIDNEEVSIKFLKRILKDDKYYLYASKFFNNEIENFCIKTIYNGDTVGNIQYTKKRIIKGLDYLIENNYLSLNENEQHRFDELKKNVSFDKFLLRYKGQFYDSYCDDNDYSVSVDKMISLMMLSKEEFKKLCDNEEIKEIEGIPKEYFIYSAYTFFRDSGVFHDFILPNIILERYEDIKSFMVIDLQAINRFLETTDSKFEEANINKDLENLIIDGMPEDISELEKAIYIYIKMCKILTYDDEYYAINQRGIEAEKHRNINYVSNITPVNNKIVCYEFNLIYSKLLNDLGIKFTSNYMNMIGEAYGAGHANLKFRCGKFIAKADSVTSILQGDLMQAKLNQPLCGLKCMNCNADSYREFNELVSKMYELVAKQENKSVETLRVEHIQTFEEIMMEYSKVTTNVKKVDLNEKISILVNKVNSTDMIGIDSLSYVLQLRKILFDAEERANNISITIIRNNKPNEQNKSAMASAIFAVNNKSFSENENQTIYYYLDEKKELISISKVELQSKFDEKIFEYIETNDPKIPGIVEKGISK